MIEVKAGVFVGRVTPRVRDELWEAAVKGSRRGSCLQLWDALNEQGYAMRSHGDPSYRPVDMEGLVLIRRPKPQDPRLPGPPE
jgi:CRISPR-associated protein Cas2